MPPIMREITAQPKFQFAGHLGVTDFCAEFLEDMYFLLHTLTYGKYCCKDICCFMDRVLQANFM